MEDLRLTWRALCRRPTDALTAVAGRVLQASLFGATPWDPVVYANAVAVVVLMAFAAAYLPARRASRVDPMVALRDE